METCNVSMTSRIERAFKECSVRAGMPHTTIYASMAIDRHHRLRSVFWKTSTNTNGRSS